MKHQWAWHHEDTDNNYFQCAKCLGEIGFNKPGVGEPAADRNGPVPLKDGTVWTIEDYYDPDDCPGAATSPELMASLTKALFSVKSSSQLVADGTLTSAEAAQLEAIVADANAVSLASTGGKKP